MVKEHLDYIDKQECERRGFVRGADGLYYKRSTQERDLLRVIYEDTNWLQYFSNDTYNGLSRYTAGKRLREDFIKSGINKTKTNNPEKVRVDGCGQYAKPKWMSEAENRYFKATRAIPLSLRNIVIDVCCYNEVRGTEDIDKLRTGLDFLIRHYFWGL
jgi:hypothetical protein